MTPRPAQFALFQAGLQSVLADPRAMRRRQAMFSRQWVQVHLAPLKVFGGMIVGGLALNLVAYLMHRYDVGEWWESTVHLLSDSLVIAGTLGLTVDTFLKQALLRNVASIFIGWALPQEIRDQIRDIGQTAIVRRNLHAHYKLRVENGEVVADLTQSWDVFNYSTARKEYRSSLADDLHEKPDRSAVSCLLRHEGSEYLLSGEDFANSGLVEEVFDQIKWMAETVMLRAQDIDDTTTRPACSVTWKSRLRMPMYYSTVISFTSPCIGVKVTVDCPDELVFSCQRDEPAPHADAAREWHHDKLFAAGQVLRVRWKPADMDDRPKG